MKERITKAYLKAYTLGERFQGVHEIAQKDQKIVQKYIDIGLLQYSKGKKGKMSKEFYFPTLEAPEFKDLSMTAWLRIMQLVISQLGINSGLSKNSAKEYLSRGWRYGVTPKILPDSYVSKADRDLEAQYITELYKEARDVD